jgi:hypothetical protein
MVGAVLLRGLSQEASYALALLLALVVLWERLFTWRLRVELRRVRKAEPAPKERPGAAPLAMGTAPKAAAHKAAMLLDDLATVAALKKEAAETVEQAKVASLDKVLEEKTVALAKVEEELKLDGTYEDLAQAERTRLDVARCDKRRRAPLRATFREKAASRLLRM